MLCVTFCQRWPLCIEWRLPCKVLLTCPSALHPSINQRIRPRHTSLGTRAETRSTSTSFISFSRSLRLLRGVDCHIRTVCQSKGRSDKAGSIYLSVSAQPIEERIPEPAYQNVIQTPTSQPLAPIKMVNLSKDISI